jgi:hypothetical protein
MAIHWAVNDSLSVGIRAWEITFGHKTSRTKGRVTRT